MKSNNACMYKFYIGSYNCYKIFCSKFIIINILFIIKWLIVSLFDYL